MSALEPNLPSIRTRAIELSEMPDLFSQPLPEFNTPGEYKREADAHLAICIDAIAAKITDRNTDETVHAFAQKFSKTATELFPGHTNSTISALEIAVQFGHSFGNLFREDESIKQVLKYTGIGVRTEQVCKNYDAAARTYIADNPQLPESVVNHWLYLKPAGLINNGLGEMQNVFQKVVMAMPYHPGSLAERETSVREVPKAILGLSSLSINQLMIGREPLFDAPVDQTLHIAAGIPAMREAPVYRDPSHAVLRPYGMCPALPRFPENERLVGGSGLLKLAELGSKLVVASNLHALGRDDLERPIFGRNFTQPV